MSDMSQWRVLLVDDEPDSLQLIHDLLAHNGIEVHKAAGGDECLRLLQTFTPTLIVMDLAMPKPDGWELLAQVRANPATATVPVVAITAYHSITLAHEALEHGFSAYFPKPIKSHEFLNALQQVVS
jgi:two-component system, cell cycle response regulator DivK